MKLSVITINYNNRDGLIKTIESVVNQTCRDFEYIIIDGGSTDGSVDVIKQYADKIDYWVSEPDKGIYNAMNKGIAVAHGEYLNFMNSGDCFYESTVVENVLPNLCSADFYVGNIYVDNNGQLSLLNSSFVNHNLLNQIIFSGIPHQATFIRKETFDKFGYYREDLKIVSDFDHFYKAIMLNNADIQPMNIAIVIYDNSGISSNYQLTQTERLLCLEKYPLQKELYLFYRENYEIMTAIKSTKIGYFLMRVYFFFYRHFLK